MKARARASISRSHVVVVVLCFLCILQAQLVCAMELNQMLISGILKSEQFDSDENCIVVLVL